MIRCAPYIAATVLWLSASMAMAIGVDSIRLEDEAQEAYAQQIMQDLRCLVCQNQSIVDSDAPLAADLRAIVRERVSTGDDKAAVMAFMVERYGDWVLLKPPVKPQTWLLWFAAPAIIVLALVAIVRTRKGHKARQLSTADAAKADAFLKDL